MRNKKGFTLLELLIAIAVIAILSAAIIFLLNPAETLRKTRDLKRAADIKQIESAVRLYWNDVKHYPDSNNAWTSFDSPSYSVNPIVSPNATNLSTALAPYINGVADPKNLGSDSGYLYRSSPGGVDYCILFWRTPEDLRNFKNSLVNYYRCTGGITANGQCIGSSNSIYLGTGQFAGGC